MRSAHIVAGALVAYGFVISLVPTTLGYLNPDLLQDTNLASGSLDRQIQLSMLFLVALALLYRHRTLATGVFRHVNPFLVAVILYCLLSAAWSLYPVVTLKRVVILIGLVLVGIVVSPPLAGRLQFQRMFLTTLMAICVLSVVVAVAFPSIGVDPIHAPAWRGITYQKNTLGMLAAYALVLWLFEWTRKEYRHLLCVLGIALSLLVLVAARSSTAVLMALFGVCVYGYWHRLWFRHRFPNLVVLLACLFVLLLSAHFYYVTAGNWLDWSEITGPIAGLFDKGTDLTGRTSIWRLLLVSIREHPFFGMGYGSFWLGEGSPAQYIADALRWMPPQGHDGYLDLVNELGVVGLGLFLLLIVWHLRSIAHLMKYDRQEAALHLAFLCIILASNVVETDFLSDTAFQNMLLIFSSVWLSARQFVLQHSSRPAWPRSQSLVNRLPQQMPGARP